MTAREELASLPLHQRIAAVIERAGVTQEEFAARIGVDRPRANAWVRGRRGVGRDNAKKIADLASQVFGETLPAELFMSERPQPTEEAVAQLVQTGRALEEVGRGLVGIVDRLVPLLERQEALVAEMRNLVNELRRHEAASEGG